MDARGRLLLIDDQTGETARIIPSLRQRGYRIATASTVERAVRQVTRDRWDCLLVGPSPGGADPIDALRQLSTATDAPILLLAPGSSPELFDQATRTGAFAVLSTPTDPHALDLTLDRALEHVALRRELERLEEVVRSSGPFEGLLGTSPAMQRLYTVLERAAESSVPVLLTGESGTGKELVARALHQRGARSSGPFVPVNLAAIPDGLLESELFGHARGAFTDARSARRGLFSQANGGTLFLDEVGELSTALQPKLLRALQERTVRPVGGDHEIPFDARIVAATNQDVQHMVSQGTMRRDVYYRLAVIQVELPPLRARGGDVLVLAEHFLSD
ncbi:MAG: sigma-54-dependent Fis family transcriptional regulator, partial [Oligoflexia bacterium]|nr:sigma-54-dependent Fis family transcriptional regulator [Oligoflexia bacterium]